MSAITHLYAGVPVSDLDASVDWYITPGEDGRAGYGADQRGVGICGLAHELMASECPV